MAYRYWVVALLLLAGMAPLPAGAAEEPAWSFAVVADPHLSEDRAGEPTGVEKFRRVAAEIVALDPKPEFALILGDIHPKRLPDALKDLALPVHVMAGNHETAADRKQLREMFPDDFQGRDFYAFEHKGSQFIVLCTAAQGDHVGHLESQFITPGVGQGEWLEKQLAERARHRHSFIFGHIPPEPENRPNGMCLSQNDSRYVQDLVKKHRPTALFFGHRHTEVNFAIGGIPVYGARSCNWNSRNQPTGFLVVKVLPEKADVRFVEVPMK